MNNMTLPDPMLDRLGRLEVIDHRDLAFPAHPLVRRSLADPDPATQEALDRGWRYWWDEGWWGNQGNTPKCVSFALDHLLEDGPFTHAPRAPGQGPLVDPDLLYREAQKRDEWPGENYQGTSARGACKYLQEIGVISEYQWYWTLDDLVQGILTVGPAAFGSIWTTGMFETDAMGFLHPTGSLRGGHETVINGVNTRAEKFRFKNSWGRRWGQNGQFWMSFKDVEFLLERAGGDAVTVTEV